MLFKKKKEKKFIRGGFKQYRNPSVFGSGQRLKELEKKKPKLRGEKQKPFPIKIFMYSLFGVLILWLLFLSPYFKVKEVIVEGMKLTDPQTVSAYAKKGDNIFFFSMANTKKRILSEHPEIKDIMIYKGIPDAIKFVVLEEDPKLIWQTGEEKYLVSAQGKVAQKVTEGEFADLPVVVDKKGLLVKAGDNIVSPNFIAFLNNINSNFSSVTNIKITRFEIEETTFDLNAYTDAGFYVKFNTMRGSAKQLEDLKNILNTKRDQIHEYIDLRINGWGYYK